jgi:hypothetical protein
VYQVRIFDQEHPVLVNACSATKLQNDRLDSSKLAEQVAALPDRTAAAEFSTAGQSSRPVPPAEVDVCLAQHQSASGCRAAAVWHKRLHTWQTAFQTQSVVEDEVVSCEDADVMGT